MGGIPQANASDRLQREDALTVAWLEALRAAAESTAGSAAATRPEASAHMASYPTIPGSAQAQTDWSQVRIAVNEPTQPHVTVLIGSAATTMRLREPPVDRHGAGPSSAAGLAEVFPGRNPGDFGQTSGNGGRAGDGLGGSLVGSARGAPVRGTSSTADSAAPSRPPRARREPGGAERPPLPPITAWE
jgi:hypothetical protein